MLGTLLLVLLLALILWLVYWYYRVHRWETLLKKIPGPRPLPLMGNAFDFPTLQTITPKLMEYCQKYNGVFKVFFGSKAYLIISKPEDLEVFLNSEETFSKSNFYEFFRNWIGNGLLTGTGEQYKRHRKIIVPAFSFSLFEKFIEVFNTQTDILLKRFAEESKKIDSFNVLPLLNLCTSDIICETAMGIKLHMQLGRNSEYLKSVRTLASVGIERLISPILGNSFLYHFTEMHATEKRALTIVHKLSKSVIHQRKLELESKEKTAAGELEEKKKRVLLDVLLEHSTKDPSFTELHIREEVDTFMVAGNDTISNSTSFLLNALAKYPDIQRRAYEEIASIFSDNLERHITYSDLQEMQYLEMVIKETLRLYTTVPFIGRVVGKELVWNGIKLPKGLMVMLFLYGTHHLDSLYEDPYKFDPERFTPENMKGKHPLWYVPFSVGARNCVGQKQAMLEIKVIISKILRKFEVLPTIPEHRIIFVSEGVLKSDNGVYLRMRKRR